MDTAQQVKSKKRVADHGEVFTAAREVNAMLDLVKNETERTSTTTDAYGHFLKREQRRAPAVLDNIFQMPLEALAK